MLRRGILKARVLLPSRRSGCFIALSEMAIDGLAHPDIWGAMAAHASMENELI
jgi:hypothetical protein